MTFLRKGLPVFILFLTVLYGFGDYLGWWDRLCNRDTVELMGERFKNSQGWPEVIIFDDEVGFAALLNFIKSRSTNDSLKHDSRPPTAIARFGGTVEPPMSGGTPENWLNFRYALETSPIIFIYEYNRDSADSGQSIHASQVRYACTLSELSNWVEESRNRERFYVVTVLLSILSLTVLIMEYRKESVQN